MAMELGNIPLNTPVTLVGIVDGVDNLRYSIPAAVSVSDATSTAALVDRAVNTVTVGAAVTTLNLTFPAAVAGYARDFFVRLDCAGTALATIALPSGETVDFGADALAGLTGKVGVHLALFTEIAANHWLISVRESES